MSKRFFLPLTDLSWSPSVSLVVAGVVAHRRDQERKKLQKKGKENLKKETAGGGLPGEMRLGGWKWEKGIWDLRVRTKL